MAEQLPRAYKSRGIEYLNITCKSNRRRNRKERRPDKAFMPPSGTTAGTASDAYRQAALDRGWEEDTSLDIHGNGSWGNPIDTRNARYDVLTNSANIEEYLYGREYAVDRSPEEMYFNLYVEDEGDYWTIYFIFAYDM